MVANAIERRLQARRERLAKLLRIRPDEIEWQGEAPPYPDASDEPEVERYLAWRHTSSPGGRLVPRIDLAIGELVGTLRRCWSLLRDVNPAISSARVFRALEAIERNAENFIQQMESLDPMTRGLIEDFYPGGWMALAADPVCAEALSRAAADAKKMLPVPSRGRPKGTKDYAGDQLGRELAETFARYSESKPTRRVISDSGGHEYGPYREFVEAVMEVVPSRLRRTSKGGLKRVDHLVRMGVAHLRTRSTEP